MGNIERIFQIKESLQEGQIYPFYYLFGKERYLKEKISSIITDAFFGGNKISPFNVETYHAKDLKLSQLILAFRTVPLDGEKKLILVRDADTLTLSLFEKLLSFYNPSSKIPLTNLIIFFADELVSPLLPARFQKKGKIIRIDSPNKIEISYWIEEMAKNYEKRIDAEAQSTLLEKIGSDLATLNGELERISLFVGEAEEIKKEDILNVLSYKKRGGASNLLVNLKENRPEESMKTLKFLLNEGEDPLKILGILSKGVRLSLSKASNYQKVYTIWENLLKTDLSFKSSRINKRIWLERLLIQLGR